MTELATYIKTNGLDSSHMKLWITGHSRGAAVANLLSAGLVEKNGLPNYEIEQGSIFAYTFATPNVEVISEDTVARYGNIFNYVNTEDFVPGVPLRKWGYGKYGVTGNFVGTQKNNDSLFVEHYIKAGRAGFSVGSTETQHGLNVFYRIADTVDSYYKKFHEDTPGRFTMFDVTYNTIAEGAMGRETINLPIGGSLPYLFSIVGFFISNKDSTIFYSHTPETYLAYIEE